MNTELENAPAALRQIDAMVDEYLTKKIERIMGEALQSTVQEMVGKWLVTYAEKSVEVKNRIHNTVTSFLANEPAVLLSGLEQITANPQTNGRMKEVMAAFGQAHTLTASEFVTLIHSDVKVIDALTDFVADVFEGNNLSRSIQSAIEAEIDNRDWSQTVGDLIEEKVNEAVESSVENAVEKAIDNIEWADKIDIGDFLSGRTFNATFD